MGDGTFIKQQKVSKRPYVLMAFYLQFQSNYTFKNIIPFGICEMEWSLLLGVLRVKISGATAACQRAVNAEIHGGRGRSLPIPCSSTREQDVTILSPVSLSLVLQGIHMQKNTCLPEELSVFSGNPFLLKYPGGFSLLKQLL